MLLIRSKSPIMLGITLWSGVVYPVKFPGIPWHKCAIVLAESSSTQIVDISMTGLCIKAWEWCRRVQDFIARNEVTLSCISCRKAEKRESWTEVYMQHWSMATWYTYQQWYLSSVYVYEYTIIYLDLYCPIPCIWNIHMYKVKHKDTKHM